MKAPALPRERTGVGFYANMGQHRLSRRRPVASAWAHVYGLHDGMTFLLWADDDGYLTSLEGVGFGDADIDAIDFDSVKIEFFDVPEAPFSGFKPPPPSWAA